MKKIQMVDLKGQYEAIKEIYITKNEQVAVVTFESGCIGIYDTKNGYSLIGEIND